MEGRVEVELGQRRRLVIQRISSSLMGRVDGRSALSGGAADARERARRFRPQLSPPSPGDPFPPTSTTVPPAQVVPQCRQPTLYLFIYFIYVPEDSCRTLRCSRALLFKVGLRYVSGGTRAQFLTVNSGVAIPEIAPENSSAMPLEAKDCAILFRVYCCIVKSLSFSVCALCMKVFCVMPWAMCSTVR